MQQVGRKDGSIGGAQTSPLGRSGASVDPGGKWEVGTEYPMRCVQDAEAQAGYHKQRGWVRCKVIRAVRR
jgi:hypothetical protein